MSGKIVNNGVERLGNAVESWSDELKARESLWEKNGVLKQKRALMNFLDRLLAKVKESFPESIDDMFRKDNNQYMNKFTKVFKSKLKFSFGKEAKYLKNFLNTIPAEEKSKLISEFAKICHYNYVNLVDDVLRINFAGHSIRDIVVKMDDLELKYPKISSPKIARATTKESWLKKFFGKKAQPPKGTVVVEEGITPPKGGKLLGFIGGVATGAALFVLDYPGIGHAARISDDIYYGLKPALLSNYRGDVHKFASAFEFYRKRDILTDKGREKYPLLDFANEYTELASAKEKHNLSGSELKDISRIYLSAKKSLGSLKFSVEELISARKWYNSLNDNEFKQKYSFERLLIKYNRSKTNFHNAEYIQKMDIDLEKGGGDLVLREVMKRMYSNIALNEFKRPILKTKRD